MVSYWRVNAGVLVLALVSQTSSPDAGQRPASDSVVVSTRTASVDGLELQYLSAGHGPAIVLLHGYAETSRIQQSRDLAFPLQRTHAGGHRPRS
jgi:hypothetical protein